MYYNEFSLIVICHKSVTNWLQNCDGIVIPSQTCDGIINPSQICDAIIIPSQFCDRFVTDIIKKNSYLFLNFY